MIVVKIGGSLITDKRRYRTFRRYAAEKIISVISGEKPAIIVHGGGSFGHIASRKYDLPGPLTERNAIGGALVKNDMADLNNRIVSIMIRHGIRAVGISPFTLFNGDTMDYSPVTRTVKSGFIPVIYGDFYTDGKYGGIISGDDLMIEACRLAKPEKAIFLSDVDGVFDRDPKKYRNAKLISKYEKHELNFSTVKNDVTGGMDRKFRSMLQCRALGIKTYLINGNYPERMRDVGSENFMGTEF